MSNLEHYFENLLFYGGDIKGGPNKKSLTKQEQEAVEACAQYVLYVLFDNREDFSKWLKGGAPTAGADMRGEQDG